MIFKNLKFGRSYYYKPLDCLACFSLNPFVGNNDYYFKVYTCQDLKKTYILLTKENIKRQLYEIDNETLQSIKQLYD